MPELTGLRSDAIPTSPEITPERLRDLRNWRGAAERLQYSYYKRELGIALYDWAPSILSMAEEAIRLRRENEELRDRLSSRSERVI